MLDACTTLLPTLAAAPPPSGPAGDPTPLNWVLLIVYLVLAIGVSFLCSLLEASLLTLTPTDAAVMTAAERPTGPKLQNYLDNIDRPLTAILTLNTISHTFGAAGIGQQSFILFGSAWVTVASIVVTLLILVLSEIIPKTLGATHAKRLAPFTVRTIAGMIFLLYPLIVPMTMLSKRLGGGHQQKLSRAEFGVLAQMGSEQGALNAEESNVIQNLLRLKEVQVRDVMTPRNIVFMLHADTTVKTLFDEHPRLRYARMPVHEGSTDHLIGLVLRHDLLEASRDGRDGDAIRAMLRPIEAVPESANVADVLEQMVDHRVHLLQAVDEFGGTAGIVTLEDCVETLLGVEIVDETDQATDMREVARKAAEQWRARRAEGN